ncbi:MAG: aldo/keto reductase [Alphaproteobacteria bacterium]|nr:aldo/keto reductase [Alphaproteobacteria bacterium]
MKGLKLNDGNVIPQIGFGVFLIPNDGSTYNAVKMALQSGYRHIDTAAAYFNEEEVGQAVRESGIKREEIFVTSKLWLQDYGYEAAKKGIDTSLRKLGVDYIDLYLLHQPYFDTIGAWQALVEAQKEGKIKSIGVSNMTPRLFNDFISQTKVKPAVNQVECNPYFQQKELREVLKKHGTLLEAWYPLGHGNKELLSNEILAKLAQKYHKSAVQIILRWHIQEGNIALPKATSEAHIKDNIDVFDFALSDEEMAQIRALDTGKGTHNPEAEGVGEVLLKNYKVHD